ncbi:uncharacterized protein [Amphiura filiformis]|uniref:uncharacterized protein n=1 Tax=Amphiura filiformis TaxID=82378 RepID=UPI003B220825
MKYRKIREIGTTEFMRDIESSSLYTKSASDLEELVNQYETVMGMLLNKHAPLVEKSVIGRPHCPWYTDELRLQKKRQAERKYTKSKLEIDKQIYADHSKSYKTTLETAKRDHHRSKIEDCDSKELFRVVDKLCNPAAELALPDHNSEDELAENLLHTSMKKSKRSAMTWTRLINPRHLLQLEALVLAHLRLFVNSQVMTSARSFMGKLLERCCLAQIQEYFMSNYLYAEAQSAYRPNHSTETALLRVQNDILLGLDKHQEAALILLDLSAAFDTIDHTILLDRLQERYGICGAVHAWFRSYLDSRTQTVVIGDSESRPRNLVYGVPQDDKDSAVRQVEQCVKDIKAWAVTKLQFNDSKTEVLHLTSCFKDTSNIDPVIIGDSVVTPCSQARNLGVVFDEHITMESHISNILRAGWACIYKLGKIRRFWTAHLLKG